MTVLPIAPLLAEAIHEVFEDGSVTSCSTATPDPRARVAAARSGRT